MNKIKSPPSIETRKRMSLSHIKYPLKSIELTPRLAYISGVLLGDGYICYNDKKPLAYYIGLETADKDFALKFKKELEIWSEGKASFRIRNKRFNKILGKEPKSVKEQYIVTLNSKPISKFLKDLSKTILDDIENKDENIKIGFIKGLYDSEGYVQKYKIGFSNTDLKLVNKLIRILKSLGFKKLNAPYKVPSDIYKDCYNFVMGHKDNLKLFNKKIGFTIGRKQVILDRICNEVGFHIKPTTKSYNEQIPKIQKLRDEGMSIEKISSKLNIPYGSVYYRLNGEEFNGRVY